MSYHVFVHLKNNFIPLEIRAEKCKNLLNFFTETQKLVSEIFQAYRAEVAWSLLVSRSRAFPLCALPSHLTYWVPLHRDGLSKALC